jgi:hypothetical protein
LELEIIEGVNPYVAELETVTEFIAAKVNDERVSPLDFYGLVLYNIAADLINVEIESVFEQLRVPLTPKQHDKVSAFAALRSFGRSLTSEALDLGIIEGWYQASRATEEERREFLNAK